MRVALTVFLAVACALLVACSNGSQPRPSPSPGPSPEGSPDLSPNVGGVEAMRRYLAETGLDGSKAELTDPLDCADLANTDAEDLQGKFCIRQDVSIYAPGLVILFVADARAVDTKVWEVHLNLGQSAWQVSAVDYIGSE